MDRPASSIIDVAANLRKNQNMAKVADEARLNEGEPLIA
jgi:hypothetical protein